VSGEGELRAQPFAEVGDMHIEQVRECAVILIKPLLLKGGAGDDFAAQSLG
jgi:hypothetical protein